MSDPDLFSPFICSYLALIDDPYLLCDGVEKNIYKMVEGARLVAHDAVAAAAHERENEPPGDESQSQGLWHMKGHCPAWVGRLRD